MLETLIVTGQAAMQGVLLEGCFSHRMGGRGRSNGARAVGLELTVGGTGLGDTCFGKGESSGVLDCASGANRCPPA